MSTIRNNSSSKMHPPNSSSTSNAPTAAVVTVDTGGGCMKGGGKGEVAELITKDHRSEKQQQLPPFRNTASSSSTERRSATTVMTSEVITAPTTTTTTTPQSSAVVTAPMVNGTRKKSNANSANTVKSVATQPAVVTAEAATAADATSSAGGGGSGKKLPACNGNGSSAISTLNTVNRRKSQRNQSPNRKRQEQQIIFNSLKSWNVNIVAAKSGKSVLGVSGGGSDEKHGFVEAAAVASTQQKKIPASIAVNNAGGAGASSNSNNSSSTNSNSTSSNSSSNRKGPDSLRVVAEERKNNPQQPAGSVPIVSVDHDRNNLEGGKKGKQAVSSKKGEVDATTWTVMTATVPASCGPTATRVVIERRKKELPSAQDSGSSTNSGATKAGGEVESRCGLNASSAEGSKAPTISSSGDVPKSTSTMSTNVVESKLLLSTTTSVTTPVSVGDGGMSNRKWTQPSSACMENVASSASPSYPSTAVTSSSAVSMGTTTSSSTTATPVAATATATASAMGSKSNSHKLGGGSKGLLNAITPMGMMLPGKFRQSMKLSDGTSSGQQLPSPPHAVSQHHSHNHHHSTGNQPPQLVPLNASTGHLQISQQQPQPLPSPSTHQISNHYSLDFLHYVGMRMSSGGNQGGSPGAAAAAAANATAALLRANMHTFGSYGNGYGHQQIPPPPPGAIFFQQSQPQQQQHSHNPHHAHHPPRHFQTTTNYYNSDDLLLQSGGVSGGDTLYTTTTSTNGATAGFTMSTAAEHLINVGGGGGGAVVSAPSEIGLIYCYTPQQPNSQHHLHQQHHHHQQQHQQQHPPYVTTSGHNNNVPSSTSSSSSSTSSYHQNNNYQQHNRNFHSRNNHTGGGGQSTVHHNSNGTSHSVGKKTWNNNWNNGGKKSGMTHGGHKYGNNKGNSYNNGYHNRKSYHYYNNHHHMNGGNPHHHSHHHGPGHHHHYDQYANHHHHQEHQQQQHLRNLVYVSSHDDAGGIRTTGCDERSQESTSPPPTPSPPQSESPAIEEDEEEDQEDEGTTIIPRRQRRHLQEGDEKSDSGIDERRSLKKTSGSAVSSSASSSSSSSMVSIPSTDSSAILSSASCSLNLELSGVGNGIGGGVGIGGGQRGEYDSDSSHSSSYTESTNGGGGHSYRRQHSRKNVNASNTGAGGKVYRSSSSTSSSGVSSTAPTTSTTSSAYPLANAQVADFFARSQSFHGSHQNLMGSSSSVVVGCNAKTPPPIMISAEAAHAPGFPTPVVFNEFIAGQQFHKQVVVGNQTQNNSGGSSTAANQMHDLCGSGGYGSAMVPPNETDSMQSGHPKKHHSGRSSPNAYNARSPSDVTEQSLAVVMNGDTHNTSSGSNHHLQLSPNRKQQHPHYHHQHQQHQKNSNWIQQQHQLQPVTAQVMGDVSPTHNHSGPGANIEPVGLPIPLVTEMGSNSTTIHTPADRFLAIAHRVEMKTPPVELAPPGSTWAALSSAVWDKFAAAQQTQERFVQKIQLWKYLLQCFRKAFPRFSLFLVGSTISGFAAESSDVDMCLVCRSSVVPCDMRNEALFQLTQLKNYFMNVRTIFGEFSVIQAKVPILRFRDTENSIVVDLNYNNCVGIRNTHLLHCYSQLDWRIRPLTLVVKLWAQHHNINDAKNMTISSYSLVLMVIHFLQYGVSPPILPCLHAMYPEKFVRIGEVSHVDLTEVMEPYCNDNTQSLGELFVQFLEYYAKFDYTHYAVSVRTASIIPIETARLARSYKNDPHHWRQLCIEEPFDLTNTARAVFDADVFEQIKSVFTVSWQRLRDTHDLASVFECEPLFIPVASTLSITS